MVNYTSLWSTALETAESIRTKQVSPAEVMEATLQRIDAINPKINAIIWRNDEDAMADAVAATDRIMHSDPSQYLQPLRQIGQGEYCARKKEHWQHQ